MSKEEENKAIVTRWFEQFWGMAGNLGIVDELGTPDVLVHTGAMRGTRGLVRLGWDLSEPGRHGTPRLWSRGVSILLLPLAAGDRRVEDRPRSSISRLTAPVGVRPMGAQVAQTRD